MKYPKISFISKITCLYIDVIDRLSENNTANAQKSIYEMLILFLN